jgi:DNA-binding beta-propeller fold protein YncE
VGIAVHPTGRYVYVVNSNFSATYDVLRGGSIGIYDADTLEPLLDAPYRFGSYGGRVVLSASEGSADTPDQIGVAVRGDSGIVILNLSEDGSQVSCSSTAADGCALELGRDIYDLTPIPRPSIVPENFEFWMASGLDGRVYLISIPDRDIHRAEALVRGVAVGSNVLRVYPPTGEVFLGARFSPRISALSYFALTDGTPGGIVIDSQTAYPSSLSRAEARDLQFSTDLTRAWVTTQSPSALMTLDVRPASEGVSTNQVLRRVDLDGNPAEMVVVNEGGRDMLYIALAADEAVAVVDGETGERVDTIPLGALAFGMAHDGVRHQRLYVTLFDENAVAVIDLDPNSPAYRSVIAEIR